MFSSVSEFLFPKGHLGTGIFMESDDAWDWMTAWLAKQSPVRNANDVTLETEQKEANDEEYEFKYMPSVGSLVLLNFKGRKVWMERIKEKEQGTVSFSSRTKDILKISSMSQSLDHLKELVHEAQRVHKELTKGMTKIYFPDSNGWSQPRTRPSRPLSSVILGAKTKDEIINDAEEFLASREWYAARGLPYRRGYLLYGPPGCGKSSFIFALAGHLGLNICVLNLSQPSMTDTMLQTLMDDLPARSILLLEDVDAAFGTRQIKTEQHDALANGEPVEKDVGAGVSSLSGPDSRSSISFSGLLNALDGVAASEGRVLFLTTNHIEKLDPALIRPGRVDLRAYFGLAGKEQLRGLFLQFYPKEDLRAEKFAKAAPSDKLSMAALQGHFLAHKKSPEDAVENASVLFSGKTKSKKEDGSDDEAKDETPSLRMWRKKSL